MTALVFSMLIVRTRTGRHSQHTSTAPHSTLRFSRTTRGSITTSQPMGVEIDLERVVHMDSDGLQTTRDTYDSERSKEGF